MGVANFKVMATLKIHVPAIHRGWEVGVPIIIDWCIMITSITSKCTTHLVLEFLNPWIMISKYIQLKLNLFDFTHILPYPG